MLWFPSSPPSCHRVVFYPLDSPVNIPKVNIHLGKTLLPGNFSGFLSKTLVYRRERSPPLAPEHVLLAERFSPQIYPISFHRTPPSLGSTQQREIYSRATRATPSSDFSSAARSSSSRAKPGWIESRFAVLFPTPIPFAARLSAGLSEWRRKARKKKVGCRERDPPSSSLSFFATPSANARKPRQRRTGQRR